MDPLPDTYYAKTADGVYIAYQVIGDGPIDVVSQPDWPGNIDMEQDDPLGGPWFREVASFSRLILHDRRGIGLSSRNVALPNLETRVSDLLTVLEAVGSERPVLVGIFESGAPNALLAATKPERVHSMVWQEPNPRFAWAPDYPWGRTSEDMEAELRDIELWGTIAYGRAFLQDEATRENVMPDSEVAHLAKASRNACTPDVARALARIWYETDVRSILPAVQVPTLVLAKRSREEDFRRASYVASLIPGAELHETPGLEWTEDDMRSTAEEIRRFAGVDRPAPELDTILSTVLFTDIVGSTEKQAALADHGWKKLIERHHAIVRGSLVRWHGVENDTAGDGFYATFEGPARAIRCAQEVGERVRDLGIEIRAGVHTGECELIDNKVGGLAVTIGARIASNAGPSEVLISQTVKDLDAGPGLTFADAGEHELKGVPDRWRLYRVVG
ncbi:MAG: adenylate/guanylate cyclase domain-containing protein [Actinomycetota bacterium]|nr:adenylate/guanylate cyclase domain-containing protein [Actinomycetota bacterium]